MVEGLGLLGLGLLGVFITIQISRGALCSALLPGAAAWGWGWGCAR